MLAQLALPGLPIAPAPAVATSAPRGPDAWQEFLFFQDRHHDETLFRYAWRCRTKEMESHNRVRFIRLLEAAGIQQIGVNRPNDPVDLAVNGLPVELKFANNHSRRPHYYQFKLRRSQRLGAALVACVCIVATTRGPACSTLCPFIIPVTVCGDRATIDITSDPWRYTGQWAEYRAAYHLLEGELDHARP